MKTEGYINDGISIQMGAQVRTSEDGQYDTLVPGLAMQLEPVEHEVPKQTPLCVIEACLADI